MALDGESAGGWLTALGGLLAGLVAAYAAYHNRRQTRASGLREDLAEVITELRNERVYFKAELAECRRASEAQEIEIRALRNEVERLSIQVTRLTPHDGLPRP